MIDLSTIHSQVEVKKDIIKNFKQHRVINQTALYLGTGVDLYYNPDAILSKAYDYHKVAILLKEIISKRTEAKLAFVSLGCGSCEKDKKVLEHLQETTKHNITFFGVDSSMAMIKKANKVLKDASFDSHLIFADFGALGFKEELDDLIGDHDIGIYLFFGNTFGNLNQGYIADVLNNILHKDDYLLLDVAGFETITTTIQSKLFKRYVRYLNSPHEAVFFLRPIKSFGVPEDCGKLILDITKDDATQAQVFMFKFKVSNSTTFDLGEKVNLSPNECVDLCKILVYDLGELNKFLEIKEFKLKGQILGDFHNQLLLQKQ